MCIYSYFKISTYQLADFSFRPASLVKLYNKTFLTSRIEYGNSVICFLGKSSFVKLEQFQLHVLRFTLNIQMATENDIIRKSSNASSIQERIVTLGKKWFKKAISNNPNIVQFVRNTAFKGSNTLLYILDN